MRGSRPPTGVAGCLSSVANVGMEGACRGLRPSGLGPQQSSLLQPGQPPTRGCPHRLPSHLVLVAQSCCRGPEAGGGLALRSTQAATLSR